MLNGILEDIEREKDEPEENSSEAPELFDDDEFEDLSDQETETGLVKVSVDDLELFRSPPQEIFFLRL